VGGRDADSSACMLCVGRRLVCGRFKGMAQDVKICWTQGGDGRLRSVFSMPNKAAASVMLSLTRWVYGQGLSILRLVFHVGRAPTRREQVR
jgi:hypothetical protein